MDPRDKILTIIFSGFTLIMFLSLFMILTGCASNIEATGGVMV
jgi:hypothetical protein